MLSGDPKGDVERCFAYCFASPVTEDLKPKRKIFPPKKDVLASLVHTKKGSHRTLRWGYVFSDERSASFPLGVTPLGLRSTDPHWHLRRKEFSTPLLAFRRERYVTAYGRFTVLAVQQDRMDSGGSLSPASLDNSLVTFLIPRSISSRCTAADRRDTVFTALNTGAKLLGSHDEPGAQAFW